MTTATATDPILEFAAAQVRREVRSAARRLRVSSRDWQIATSFGRVIVTTDDTRLLSGLTNGARRLRDVRGIRVVHAPADMQAAIERDLRLPAGSFRGDSARRFMRGD